MTIRKYQKTHLKRELHTDEEGEINGLQYLLLIESMFNLLQLDYLVIKVCYNKIEHRWLQICYATEFGEGFVHDGYNHEYNWK